MTTTWILIAFGVFIVGLTIVSILGIVPAVRIVPDDTKFDFIRFRRISFPISAALSILAIIGGEFLPRGFHGHFRFQPRHNSFQPASGMAAQIWRRFPRYP